MAPHSILYSGPPAVVSDIVANQLIIACAIGRFFSLRGIGLPGVTQEIFEILGRAALPLGNLALSDALKPEVIRGHTRPVAISSIV